MKMPVKKQVTKIRSQESRKKAETKTVSLRAPVKQSLKNQKVAGVNKIATSSGVKTKTTLNLSVPVYSLAGGAAGTMSLPKEIFGSKINKPLLAQAMRVYLNNQKGHFAHTKTRGEVKGSTRKIFKQKGTGRARHGAIRAPIFVGGGIALGPKSRKVILDLPAKMKNAALLSALAQKTNDKEILGMSGLDKASGKTKEMVSLLSKIDQKAKSFLFVTDKKMENVQRAVRNIPGLDLLPADQVNAYEIIKHQSLILTKEAVEKLQERLIK